ncbi:MAG TPA: flavodoxin-dependent (E)-4-hydroxy-3-methylbut-2-enyl-diphosphate synthase [Sedimentisphaerales bacterium]|nr:flavodoxin-dependent (E)-4-hydroxy-3-methylbut-2-enyl-diphosphate synthase [Sedimentisphaerales bacterium]HNU27996.1 flavodoxin-dependent (E)-4-hydroxy-3-methylbut-2-enyl-diphosphate synthase [Sedimentisphaerales bacterium]
MITRRTTTTVHVSSVPLGSCAPVVIQSMTKVPTTDIDRCVGQVEELVQAGCELVRIAVPRKADTEAFGLIARQVRVPLVADIHFSPARAIEAIEAGAAKIRLNPGNIKNRDDIHRIIDAAKAHNVAIRVGVNEASIRDLTQEPIPFSERVDLMLAEMTQYVRLFEDRGFDRLVLSAKTSDTLRTIEVNRRIAAAFRYPLHLGLTHAGLPEHARIPSAIALGTLLAEGIGDTIRVSAAGNPVIETGMAQEILTSLGLREQRGLELIVCPTCGRTEIDVVELARKVEQAIRSLDKPLRIAVMGCVVNGPGEAADADFAICAGKDKAYFYRNGQKIATASESEIIPKLLEALAAL